LVLYNSITFSSASGLGKVGKRVGVIVGVRVAVGFGVGVDVELGVMLGVSVIGVVVIVLGG
jgi:hypothetical protein